MLHDEKKIRTVLLSKEIDPSGKRILDHVPWIRTVNMENLNSEEIEKEMECADALIARSCAVDARFIEKAPNLKVISQHGVGVDQIDVALASARGICVTNAPGTNTESVAEFTIAFILMLAKNMIPGIQMGKSGDFSKKAELLGADVRNKVLGIIGLGNIGKQAARLAAALGMQVAAYDPYVEDEVFQEMHVKRLNELDDVFPISDFLSLHLPGMDIYRGLINERRLKMMKPSAYLINCSRGILADETALAEALKNGIIAGAALDVTQEEPLQENHPLRYAPHVYITPHMAAITRESMAGMSKIAVENVISVLEGRQPESLVNPQVWKNRRK